MVDYEKKGYSFDALVRPAPAAKCLNKQKLAKIDGEYVPEYMRFLSISRTPAEVVTNVIKMAEGAGFTPGYNPNRPGPFYKTSRDANAFALVNPGRGSHRLNRGLRIIVTHVDSPCLKLRESPTLFDNRGNDSDLLSGALLLAEPYGEIEPARWFGMNLRFIAQSITKGHKKKTEFPCFSPTYSLHLKDEERQFTKDDLAITTGFNSVGELYKFLEIKRESDFERMKAHIVPAEKPKRIAGGHLISGYGHDDKVCVYATVKALLESAPTSPCLVFGLDQEEIGSSGPNTAYRGFFRRIINEVVSTFSKSHRRLTSPLEDQIENGLLQGVPAISADADTASTIFEASDERIEEGSIAKFCHGPFIYTHEASEGNPVSIKDIDYIMTLLEETLGQNEKAAHQRFQVMGKPLKPDVEESSYTLSRIFAKENIPSVDVGIPVGCLHNPIEIVSAFDLYWGIQAYKAYFMERPSNRGGRKRKFS